MPLANSGESRIAAASDGIVKVVEVEEGKAANAEQTCADTSTWIGIHKNVI